MATEAFKMTSFSFTHTKSYIFTQGHQAVFKTSMQFTLKIFGKTIFAQLAITL